MPGDDLEPWASNQHPTDARKRHVQDITDDLEYAVTQGGTMDGRNCRSPHGVFQPFEQSWESNRSVRMENVGEADLVNPWLSNGRNNFRTLDEIVAAAVRPGMSDGEKATALWWQEVQHRFHYGGISFDELADPVKVFNIYGRNTCGNDAACLAGLWKKTGLKALPARLITHCISQVFYDGAWHLLDGDMHCLYLLRDNETVASDADLVADHDLVKRTHGQGILQADERALNEVGAGMFIYEGAVIGDRNCKGVETSMDMTLRPGEALTWRWGHLSPCKYLGDEEMKFPQTHCNGLWEYSPDFTRDTWRKGAVVIAGIIGGKDGLAAHDGKAGVVVWELRSPYPFVGGRLEVDGHGVQFELSWDNEAWHDVVNGDLDALFPARGTVRYRYFLKCIWSGAARLKRLSIINDLQMAPLLLPGMAVGENRFSFSDQTVGKRHVRITHEWVERSVAKPPAAPAAAIYPPDQGEADGTDIVFTWQGAADAADYHFELSTRADMRWPLSMNFFKLISRTADRGKARYTLPEPGLLTPGRKYFWHVRTKNLAGVWGEWSEVWSFVPQGPTYPINVRCDFDPNKGVGLLSWKANPIGRKPVKYRVYASDEKGFSISDQPYQVNVGISKDIPPLFPANFVTETTATEVPVVGESIPVPAANKAFYRVVAVDDHGKRSGPSDFCAAPRPYIHSRPITRAKVGVTYLYSPATIRSIGDQRTRVVDKTDSLSFWNIESPHFSILAGPKWLTIDTKTGTLSGTPDTAGTAEVTVSVELTRESRAIDADILQWGWEKVLSTGTEKAGSATQRFIIDIAP